MIDFDLKEFAKKTEEFAKKIERRDIILDLLKSGQDTFTYEEIEKIILKSETK